MKTNVIIATAAASQFMLIGIPEVDPLLIHGVVRVELPTYTLQRLLTEDGVIALNNAKQITYDFYSFFTTKSHMEAKYGPGSLYMFAKQGSVFASSILDALQEAHRGGGFQAFIEKLEQTNNLSNWAKESLKNILESSKANNVDIHTVSSNIEVDNSLVERTSEIDPRIKNFYRTSSFIFVPGKSQVEIPSPIPQPGLNITNQFIHGKNIGQISALQIILSRV